MQEIWLSGKLDTLGKSDVEQRTEEDTKKISKLVQQMAEGQNNGEADITTSWTVWRDLGVSVYPVFIKHTLKGYNQMLANCVSIRSFYIYTYSPSRSPWPSCLGLQSSLMIDVYFPAQAQTASVAGLTLGASAPHPAATHLMAASMYDACLEQ